MDDIQGMPPATFKEAPEAPVGKPIERKFVQTRRDLIQSFEHFEETFKLAIASRYRARLRKNESLAYCSKQELDEARDWMTDLQEVIHDIIDLERSLHIWEGNLRG